MVKAYRARWSYMEVVMVMVMNEVLVEMKRKLQNEER